MKAGYLIESSNVYPHHKFIAVCNFHALNKVCHYAVAEDSCINSLVKLVGIWKIKTLKQ